MIILLDGMIAREHNAAVSTIISSGVVLSTGGVAWGVLLV